MKEHTFVLILVILLLVECADNLLLSRRLIMMQRRYEARLQVLIAIIKGKVPDDYLDH